MRHLKAGIATILSAAALVTVGCTERTQLRGFDNQAWAPYVSEYGPNTGVTGSSASPYVGGGIINQKPDPDYNPALDNNRVYDNTRDMDRRDMNTTTTTTIRRDY